MELVMMVDQYKKHFIVKYIRHIKIHIISIVLLIAALLVVNSNKSNIEGDINIFQRKIASMISERNRLQELVKLHNKRVFYNKPFNIVLQNVMDNYKSYFSNINIDVKPYPINRDNVRKVDIVLSLVSIGDKPVFKFVDKLEDSKDCLFVVNSVEIKKHSKTTVKARMSISSLFVEKVN